MAGVFEYYGKFQGMRGSLLGLPGWARGILFVLAIPGILALALSIMLVLCSLAALLLLTVPAYRILRVLTVRPQTGDVAPAGVVAAESSGRRHVDVRIIE